MELGIAESLTETSSARQASFQRSSVAPTPPNSAHLAASDAQSPSSPDRFLVSRSDSLQLRVYYIDIGLYT